MNWNLPNALTLLRIGLIPLFVFVFYLPYEWAFPVSSLIFGLAGLTDWFDGYLARRLDQTSAFGAFLDPVADKLMVAVALVMLVDRHGPDNLMLAIPAIIIIGREITISALREWMAEQGRRGSVAVSFIGKVKTTVQIISLLFLLWFHPILGIPIYEIGLVLLVVSAALTVWSMVYYLRCAMRDIGSEPT
ncbi:MAG: CDP-diacylglycerol--glycerol-3-phosphate 3-phosphatidyltransferase [Pseudomonadota bacterium]|nr:CDP-diacylglycerol--glycerol-3-phosphate 3-phosphatidyltransferase [Pseudomonadota bacterium]